MIAGNGSNARLIVQNSSSDRLSVMQRAQEAQMAWCKRAAGWVGAAWQWLGGNKEQLTIVFTVIAAGYVLYEYLGNLTDGAVKRTMEPQARYSEKELLSASTELNNVLFYENLDKNLAQTGLKGNAAVVKLITDLKLDSNVRQLADFYGQVATCMRNSL